MLNFQAVSILFSLCLFQEIVTIKTLTVISFTAFDAKYKGVSIGVEQDRRQVQMEAERTVFLGKRLRRW